MNAKVTIETKTIKTKEGKDFTFEEILLDLGSFKPISIAAKRTQEEELLKYLVKVGGSK